MAAQYRCARSPSIRGCQIIESVKPGTETGKAKARTPFTQSGRVSLWNRGDEIGLASKSDSGGEALYDHGDWSLRAGRVHRIVDVGAVEPPP